jgi:hypothetical protein
MRRILPDLLIPDVDVRGIIALANMQRRWTADRAAHWKIAYTLRFPGHSQSRLQAVSRG